MGLNHATDLLSSRAIQGMLWEEIGRLSADQTTLLNRIAFAATSDQASERYGWLGHVPKMKEWVGARAYEKLRASDYTIKNVHYETTLEIPLPDLRRDKTPQIRLRIGELADSAAMHFYELLLALMVAGESTLCYDGEFFYDTDHQEGKSGVQDNDLALTAVSAAKPTQIEMADLIMSMLQAMYGFLDDQGRAMNATARQFMLSVPIHYWGLANAAVANNILGGSSGVATSNALQNLPAVIDVVAVPELGSANKMYLHRTDARMKPFITQEEAPGLKIASKAEGSEFEFDNDAHVHGVDGWRNVGYGLWQYSVLATITNA